MQYDYEKNNKRKLIIHGKKKVKPIFLGIIEGTLETMGDMGLLTGEALKDYQRCRHDKEKGNFKASRDGESTGAQLLLGDE